MHKEERTQEKNLTTGTGLLCKAHSVQQPRPSFQTLSEATGPRVSLAPTEFSLRDLTENICSLLKSESIDI